MSVLWGTNIIIDGARRPVFLGKAPIFLSNLPPPNVRNDYEGLIFLPQWYEGMTRNIFDKIENQSLVGMHLMARIGASRRTLYVFPIDDADVRQTGAFASDPAAASAGGTNVVIFFEWTMWASWSRDRNAEVKANDPGGHEQPDDVLFHELFHTYRQMEGLWNPRNVTGDIKDVWDNTEELYAVMFTNIYLSSIGRDSDMRGDHQAEWHPVTIGQFQDASGSLFYLAHQFDIDGLVLDPRSRPFCEAIATVPCPWNPIRSAVASLNAKPSFP